MYYCVKNKNNPYLLVCMLLSLYTLINIRNVHYSNHHRVLFSKKFNHMLLEMINIYIKALSPREGLGKDYTLWTHI